jgi:hypothetical protein
MQTYIVRVYRAHLEDMSSVSGVIEDIESRQQEPFHSFNELENLLALSIRRGQPGLPDFVSREPSNNAA